MRTLLVFVTIAAAGTGIYFLVSGGGTAGTRTPPRTNDWVVSTPAREGFSAPRFKRAIRQIEQRDASLLALLVVRHGHLVLEHYYHGYARTSGFDAYSVTKSVTSALIGRAIADHRLDGVHETLGKIFGKLAPPRARRITIQQLLTMTSGWPGDADPRNDIGESSNITRALLHRPIVSPPGTSFRYDTSSSHLLSAVLTRALGKSEQDYAQRWLLGPMHIPLADEWPVDSRGNTFGGTGLTLFARDAAKLGLLYLHDGRWHGRQLIPAPWVKTSTREHVRVNKFNGYGYDWWTERSGGVNAFFAYGYGGQVVAVVPKLDLVVTFFSATIGERPTVDDIVFKKIVPTITRR
jgi:CubicO group peptidase (beta-lactamase class C family)